MNRRVAEAIKAGDPRVCLSNQAPYTIATLGLAKMESSSVLMTWMSLVLLVSPVFLVSGAYTVDSSNPCSKEFIKRMAVQMCSRHKRNSENDTKVNSFPLLIALPIPLAVQKKNSPAPSSLDTLWYGLLGSTEELKDVVTEPLNDLQRIERATETLMHCCLHGMCTPNDFANAC